MPRAVSADTPTLKLGYIFGMIFLTLAAFALHIIVPWAIVIALHWPVDLYDIFKTSVAEGKNATVWQGQLCVPSMLVSPTNPGLMQLRLTRVDLRTKALHEMDLPGIGTDLKLVQDGSVLWGLSGSDVIRIEGNNAQKISTGITLKNEHPFLYDGQLAVILESKNVLDELPKSYLHVWTGSAWKNIGQVLLPPIVDKDDLTANADAARKLPVTVPFDGTADIAVVNFEGRPHLFCSDGTTVLYSPHLELIPVDTASAIAPENAPATVPQWMFVGLFANFQAGADAQGLLVINPKTSTFAGPTNITSVLRLVDDAWKEVFEITEKGYSIERTLTTDGQKAYLVSQTFRETLSVAAIEGNGSQTSQVSVNSGTIMNRFQKTMPYVSWVGWVVLLIYALLVTRLMNAYCTNQYEYGDMTVELASFVRRALAKVFDLLLIFGPIMLAQWVFIGSQAQQQEWYAELFGGGEVRKAVMLGLGFTCYLFAWLVGLSISEGLWGVSPGKWLLGLRVFGTTLKPCGFFRAALREIFMLIDGFICCSWLPGVFAMTLTSCRQRLGDLISDTIVVRKRKL